MSQSMVSDKCYFDFLLISTNFDSQTQTMQPMKKLVLLAVVLHCIAYPSCDEELVATLPECRINKTGALKVENSFDQDHLLNIDSHDMGIIGPGEVRYYIYPRNSGVLIRMKEIYYDSVPTVYKEYLFIRQCDTLVFNPKP
jgi:hypothetical protein